MSGHILSRGYGQRWAFVPGTVDYEENCPTVNRITMKQSRTSFTPPQDPAREEVVRKMIETIVNDFDGDTTAFFDSIMPDRSDEQAKAEEEKARIARHFAKSI